MPYLKHSNLNYLTDTKYGSNYKQAVISCRLPYYPEIEYISYKEVLLHRIKFMISLLGRTHGEALSQLNRSGIPIIHSDKFLALPDENATEYTNALCHSIITFLKDSVVRELSTIIIKDCLVSLADSDSENNVRMSDIVNWISSNANELFQDTKSYIDLDQNGNVYVLTNNDNECTFSYDIYDSFLASL